jgi:hypothetical protein
MTPAKQKALRKQFGKDFEQDLLLNLGYAARIYNDLWQGLETERPIAMSLNLDRVFDNCAYVSSWQLEKGSGEICTASTRDRASR